MTDEPKKSGKSKVRAGIKAARPAKASQASSGSAPDYLMAKFQMVAGEGLYRKVKNGNEDGERRVWVCPPFEILAETLDEDGMWGLLLSWADSNGETRTDALPRSFFTGDGKELCGYLNDRGLKILPSSRANFIEYLSIASSSARATCVKKVGWHKIGDSLTYVLPNNETFGATSHRIVLQMSAREAALFTSAGTLEGWRSQVSEKCIRNSRMVFAVSIALAGPLLSLVGEDSGGFHLRGPSRIGKTTLLQIAASVFSAPKLFVRSWHLTKSASEGVAASANDNLMVLDEMGQIDGDNLSSVIYMIGNSQGKGRSDRSGGLRTPLQFNVMLLSSGETGMIEKNNEAGRQTRAGEEVRLVELRADAGVGLGVFEDIDDAEDADHFSRAIRASTAENHGVAGRQYIRHLADQVASDLGFVPRIRSAIDDAAAELLKPYPEATGQVRSVARRYALVAVAGELASRALITGWNLEESRIAARALFTSWLADRGTVGAREDDQAAAYVLDFIRRGHYSRFERWGPDPASDDAQQAPGAHPPREQHYVRDRAGFRKWRTDLGGKTGSWVYYLFDSAMVEALRGLDLRASCRALSDRKILRPDAAGKYKRPVSPPGEKKVRLYQIELVAEKGSPDDNDLPPTEPSNGA